jgi:hypothetical protein
MIGKILAGLLLIGLIAGAATMESIYPNLTYGGNAIAILMGTVGGAGFVWLLNLVGLGIRPKYFGAMGVVISSLILAYGIYMLVTKKAIIPIPTKYISTVGGTTTGVGAAALLTSTGILTR